MNRTVEVVPEDLPYGDHGLAGSILDIALKHGIEIEEDPEVSDQQTRDSVVLNDLAHSMSEMNGFLLGKEGQGRFIKGKPFGLCYENF